jgi:gas vesicle protein
MYSENTGENQRNIQGTVTGFGTLSPTSGFCERSFQMASDKQQAFGWFVAGLGLGALVGILYAPKSGKETREDIVTSAKDGTEYVRVRAREVADQAGTLAGRGRVQAEEYVQRGREVVERGRAQWEDFVDRGKGFVNDQSVKVTAAVDAGRSAYHETTAAPGEGPLS